MKTRRIALCMDVTDEYEHGIARGVIRFAREQAHWQLFGYGWMFQRVLSLSHWDGDGIITRIKTLRHARMFARTRCPVVDVAGSFSESGFYLVTNDDYATGRAAAEHLIGQGFRSFAWCGVRSMKWSERRRAGFFDHVKKFEAFSAFEQSLAWWQKPARAPKLERWLAKLKRPAAILACNDIAGLRITGACRQQSIRVPEELAVVGVDNDDVLCELSAPSLSSVPCDCERIGYLAASSLHQAIEAKGEAPAFIRVPPLPLAVRQSSSAITSHDPVVVRASKLIVERAKDGLSVSDVAQHVALSRRALEIRFRRSMNLSVYEAITRARLDRASRLLLDPHLPVAKIAVLSGYSNEQSFYRVFRSKFGFSPQTFRRKRLKGEVANMQQFPSHHVHQQDAADRG